MLKIAKQLELNLQDDVFFDRIALVLYAQGCKWKCKGCHSKQLWSFDGGFQITVKDIVENLNFLELSGEEITLIGQGGDFWFQLENWINFCKQIKNKIPNIKIAWQTGASFENLKQRFIRNNTIYPFDVIACERPFANKLEGENRKLLVYEKDNLLITEWKILS